MKRIKEVLGQRKADKVWMKNNFMKMWLHIHIIMIQIRKVVKVVSKV